MAPGLIEVQAAAGTSESLSKDEFSCLPAQLSVLLYVGVVGLGRTRLGTWTLCLVRDKHAGIACKMGFLATSGD